MSIPRRVPSFVLPLAVLGGAAAFFAHDLLHAGRLDAAPSTPALMAAATGALGSGLAGLLLDASPPAEEWMPARPTFARIASSLLAAGLLAGLLAQCIAPRADGPLALLTGLAGAALLVLPAHLLLAIARRAARARPASIVAHAELRAQLSLVAASLGAFSLLTLPTWIAASAHLAAPPRETLALLLAASAIVALLLLVDLLVARRIDRLAALLLDLDDPPVGARAPTPRRIDFGLGNEASAQIEPPTTYRGGGRARTTLVGSPSDARAALRRNLRDGALGLALLELVAIAHGVARDPESAAAYHAERCEDGARSACRTAALLAERAGRPLDESNRLHELACAAGEEPSCLAASLLRRRLAARD